MVLGQSLRDALASRDLRRLQLGWGVSAVASWVFFVVLAIYAYHAGGAPAVGIAAVVRMVPAGLLAGATGLLVDRHPRRDVLLAALIVRALLLTAIAAAVLTAVPLAVVLALAAALTIVSTAHKPAQAALLPMLAVSPRQLAACNVVWSAVDSAAFLVGSLLGGVLIDLASVQVAFAATALLFAIAALPVAQIERDRVPQYRIGTHGSGRVRAALVGVRDISADRDLRLLVGFLAAATFVEGAVDVLVVVVALQLFGLGSVGVGWLNACWGAGGLIGAVALLAWRGRGGRAAGLVAGGMLVGVPLIAVAGLRDPGAAAALIALLGVGYALIEVAGLSLLQRLSSDEVLGRAFAAVESAYWITTGLGAIAVPGVITLLGVRGALIAVGACLPLFGFVRVRALARLQSVSPVPENEFRALRAVSEFAPLPIAVIENVARRLSVLSVAPGTVVVAEGEPGDNCYLVAEGQLDVSCHLGPLRTLGAGDFFGEIALLRNTTRTATVIARGEALLYVLDRGAFLSAVSAHPLTTKAVAAVASDRLAHSPVT